MRERKTNRQTDRQTSRRIGMETATERHTKREPRGRDSKTLKGRRQAGREKRQKIYKTE